MSLSVLVSIYYKEKPDNLTECLHSLASQSLKANEVILVEDGPISDELKSIIESFRHELNIVSVPLTENVGLACALNEGLKHCSNEIVARMDTDDIARDERFERQMEFMNLNPEVAASSGVVEEFNEEGQVLMRRVLPLEHSEIINFAKRRSPLSHPATIFRKSAVESVGGYPEVYPEDYLLWVKLIQQGHQLANLPYELLRMRAGDEFITRRGLQFLKGELKIYRYMYQTEFINFFEYVKIIILRSVLRLSPPFVKLLLYRVAR